MGTGKQDRRKYLLRYTHLVLTPSWVSLLPVLSEASLSSIKHSHHQVTMSLKPREKPVILLEVNNPGTVSRLQKRNQHLPHACPYGAPISVTGHAILPISSSEVLDLSQTFSTS